jgi:hypothetical protein
LAPAAASTPTTPASSAVGPSETLETSPSAFTDQGMQPPRAPSHPRSVSRPSASPPSLRLLSPAFAAPARSCDAPPPPKPIPYKDPFAP